MKFLNMHGWHPGRQFHKVSPLEDQAYVLDKVSEITLRRVVGVLLNKEF